MTYYLTLVATPQNNLEETHFERAADFLKIEDITINWLAEGTAAEFQIENILTIEQMQSLRSLFDKDKIDPFCTSVKYRRKRLLVADMDSTIVTSETLDELADEAGIKDEVADITDRAMRDEIDFNDAIIERVQLLKGLSSKALARTLAQTEMSSGAGVFIKTMRQHGAFCALVSGGFTYFTENIAAQLGFNVHHGNRLDIVDDFLTGKVIQPILDKETKLKHLQDYAAMQDISPIEAIAIGDGANDLPMLEAAGLGIGYYPKPILEARLLNCIRHTDLTSALYAQGYKQSEFAV